MAVKIRMIQKLFVFLLLTVGIVFMLQLVQRCPPVEPFIVDTSDDKRMVKKCRDYLSLTPPEGCKLKKFGNDSVFVCEDGITESGQTRAMNILSECADSLQDKITSSNVPILRDTDTSCYKVSNSRTGTNFYVCYQRPPVLTVNDNTGDLVYVLPFEDETPYELSSQIPDACSAYQTTLSMIYTTFSTTTVNKSVVDNAITTMISAYDMLKGLSTTRCASGGPARNTQQTNACAVLGSFLSPYREGPTGTFSNLYNIQTALGNALSNLQNTYTNTVKPSFNGFCPAPTLSAPAGFQP